MQGGKELFVGLEQKRQPIRPLGEVSDFVVEDLPLISHENPDLLVSYISNLVPSGQRVFIDSNFSESDINISRLDLLMLHTSLAFLRPEVSIPWLRQALSHASYITNAPACLTYEDIVINNPSKDKRVFCPGSIGKSESDFYEGHRLIEVSLSDANKQLDEAVACLIENQPQAARYHLEFVLEDIAPLGQITKIIGERMPVSEFSHFRRFLMSHPHTGHKGPSGAFSANIPLLELKTAGELLDKNHINYLIENIQYFPRELALNLNQMDSKISRGETLNQLATDRNLSQVKKIAAQILISTFEFRLQHYASVARQMPSAIHSPTEGSSGEANAGEFLRDRIRSHLDVINQVDPNSDFVRKFSQNHK